MAEEQNRPVTLHLRIPSDIAAALTERATGNRRSRNAEAVRLIETGLGYAVWTPTDEPSISAEEARRLGAEALDEVRQARPSIEAVKRTVAPARGTSDIQFKRHAVNKPAHEFQPQTKNARCGECGKLRHQHGSAL